jgi:hypothetical protein
MQQSKNIFFAVMYNLQKRNFKNSNKSSNKIPQKTLKNEENKKMLY